MNEMLVALLLLSGSMFSLVAAIGLLRLPDILTRMHAATKAGVLGTGLILLSHAAYFSELAITLRVLATITFLWLTAPIAAHLIGRAAYCSRVHLSESTWVDQFAYECGWNEEEENGVGDQDVGEEGEVDPDSR